MKIPDRVYASIHLDALSQNLEHMKHNLKSGTKIIAVIKADGYGHGAIPIARHVEPLPYIWGFAVACTDEAVELRKAGIKKPVLLLGCSFEEEYETLAANEIRPTVFSLEMAEKMSLAGEKQNRRIKIHIKADTGMTRIGYRDKQEAVSDILEMAKLPGVEIEGLFTHFARADEKKKDLASGQLEKFLDLAECIKIEGVSIPMLHCSNSAGIIRMPQANLDAVRAGIILYGLYPSDEVEKEPVPLHPVMELKSKIIYIKTVEAGVEVSYGGTYTTSRETRIATIPVGYADGYPRSLSNKGYVLIHGKKAPIIGRICMDQFMVDVTEIPNAKELDTVTLAGFDGGERITMEELGDLSGRFNYEFVCDISKRVPRIYL